MWYEGLNFGEIEIDWGNGSGGDSEGNDKDDREGGSVNGGGSGGENKAMLTARIYGTGGAVHLMHSESLVDLDAVHQSTSVKNSSGADPGANSNADAAASADGCVEHNHEHHCEAECAPMQPSTMPVLERTLRAVVITGLVAVPLVILRRVWNLLVFVACQLCFSRSKGAQRVKFE